jgi:hypothetical protein
MAIGAAVGKLSGKQCEMGPKCLNWDCAIQLMTSTVSLIVVIQLISHDPPDSSANDLSHNGAFLQTGLLGRSGIIYVRSLVPLLHYASERESRQPYTGFFSFKSRGV